MPNKINKVNCTVFDVEDDRALCYTPYSQIWLPLNLFSEPPTIGTAFTLSAVEGRPTVSPRTPEQEDLNRGLEEFDRLVEELLK